MNEGITIVFPVRRVDHVIGANSNPTDHVSPDILIGQTVADSTMVDINTQGRVELPRGRAEHTRQPCV
jgi:hypothetical protein